MKTKETSKLRKNETTRMDETGKFTYKGSVVTEMRFNIATRSKKPGSVVGFLSVQLFDTVVINRVKIYSTETGYSVYLPSVDLKDSKNKTSKPLIYVNDRLVYNEIINTVLTKYKQLVEEYDGLYDSKKHGKHAQ